MNQPILIALALVWKHERLLIAQRLAGTHLAGFWEFPGGRIEAPETAELAAVREVAEETGVACELIGLRKSFCYEYPERSLEFCPVDCLWVAGQPRPLQALNPRWVSQTEILECEFPPANRSLLHDLQLDWGPIGTQFSSQRP